MVHQMSAEFKPPPLSNIFQLYFLLPFIFYFCLFVKLSSWIKANFYLEYSSFKRYRLQNLTVCLIHSFIVACCVLIFFVCYQDKIFNDIIHYDHWLHRQIVIFSQAYFVHDLIDMSKYEWNKYTLELALHHIATFFFLGTAIWSGKFLIYALWALAMEVNSVFLHLRTIFNISGVSKEYPILYRWLLDINIFTAIFFRLGVQAFQIQWAFKNLNNMHTIYGYIALGELLQLMGILENLADM
ncbi:TRAM/LAG1/CLN8 homology domain-containing protein [Strongyloides ratti]|uniref:TRAM/LAG1/CLN8 homology domain-containing protein n=1 Tax=Strongyloides ratti TaxID=34506 RepID=A0A090MYT6_STRRB|nr:TRAM/LAG1/CLN8 homology domain-containing protein [Strongyloides ratti]CEF67749.1 TRAM/LAG1/CLN8 homology domain-containing protein [Strongyloides ratti]